MVQHPHMKKLSSNTGFKVFSLRSDFCLVEVSLLPLESAFAMYSLTNGSARPLGSIGGRFLHSNTREEGRERGSRKEGKV